MTIREIGHNGDVVCTRIECESFWREAPPTGRRRDFVTRMQLCDGSGIECCWQEAPPTSRRSDYVCTVVDAKHGQSCEKLVLTCASYGCAEARCSDANLDLSSQIAWCDSCHVCNIDPEHETRSACVDGSSNGSHEECYHVDGQPVLRDN